MPRSLRPQFNVTPKEQQDLNKLLKKFEAKEVKELGNNPKDLMYAIKLIEHYKNIEETGGHLYKRFVEGPLSIEQYTHHKAFFDATKKYKQVLFRAANRVGKEVRISEPVLTPNGWVRIGDLNIGDKVCAPDGSIANVIGVYDQGRKQIYRVHFNDGTYADCGLEHRWRCKTPEARFRKISKDYGKWSVKSLQEIIDHVGMNPTAVRRYSIPVVERLTFNEKPLPIDPYTVGVLLGDGSIRRNCRLHSADADILDLIDWTPTGSYVVEGKSCVEYYFSGRLDQLRAAGLYGQSCREKFVPEEYKLSNSRLAVLQGLMDTDGYTNGRTCEFVSVSKQLAQDVADIGRSLGIRCTLKEKKTSCAYKGKKVCGTAWRVNFWTTSVPLFRLPRKANKQQLDGQKKNGSENVIVKIEKIDEDYARCIEVDSLDHTYVISNYLVTHNSDAGAFCASSWTTGIYADWWEGREFYKPTFGLVCGDTNDTVREILQAKLLGSPRGTGFIPADCLEDVIIRPNTGGTADSIIIRHKPTGKLSRIKFKTYEQGAEAFYGLAPDWVWFDEEPTGKDAALIWNQGYTRLLTTQGTMIVTFTPLMGWTPILRDFCDTATDLTPPDEEFYQ